MPELPEVETIKKGLQKKVLNKTITNIKVKKIKLLNLPLIEFKSILEKNSFTQISRKGKLLIFHLNKPKKYLLIHLKMTGQLVYQNKNKLLAGGHPFPKLNKLPNKYSHIIITFSDNSQLFFNDQRQFGYFHLVNKAKKDKVINKFGIEPLTDSFSFSKFKNIFKNRKTSIKSVLLNQKLLAGIGNIYADEICFMAKIRPQRKVNTLNKKELKKLFLSCSRVLNLAILKGGTTFSDYRDSWGNKGNFSAFLKVYGQAGQKCQTCRIGIIKKIKVAQRGTHFCPICQK